MCPVKTMIKINLSLKHKIYILIVVVLLLTIPAIDLVRAQCTPLGAACSTTPSINTGVCGNRALPVMSSGANTSLSCPSGCTGNVNVSCSSGVYTATSNCTVPVGACGQPTCYSCLPGTMPGSTCQVDFGGLSTDPTCGGPFFCY